MSNQSATSTIPIDSGLYEYLRQLRYQLANKAGISAFQIFHNTTLEDLCRYRPIDNEHFIQIPQIGPHKLQVYGSQFIDSINNYCRSYHLSTNIPNPAAAANSNRINKKRNRSESALERVLDGIEDESRLLLDNGLISVLIELRNKLSIEFDYTQTPYIIYSNSELRDLALYRPIDDTNLLKITGIGQYKLSHYGSQIINTIAQYCQINHLTTNLPHTILLKSPVTTVKVEITNSTAVKVETTATAPSINCNSNNSRISSSSNKFLLIVRNRLPHPWLSNNDSSIGNCKLSVLELFNQGYSFNQISEMRDIKIRTVENYLNHCYSAGYDINWNRLNITETELLLVYSVLNGYYIDSNYSKPAPTKKSVKEAIGDLAEIGYCTIHFCMSRYAFEHPELQQ